MVHQHARDETCAASLATGKASSHSCALMLTHVLAAVVQKENRYLVCRRPAHKRHGGLWEFPGGKLESSETHFAAAKRELAEELGVQVASIGNVAWSVSDPGSEFVIDFVPTVIVGEPSCLEHSALLWVTIEELQALDLAPADRSFAMFLQTAEAVKA
jgi:8-oxo-dGTP diphosphatase